MVPPTTTGRILCSLSEASVLGDGARLCVKALSIDSLRSNASLSISLLSPSSPLSLVSSHEEDVVERAKQAKEQWESDVTDKAALGGSSVFEYTSQFESMIMSARKVVHDKDCKTEDERAELEAEKGKLDRARERKIEEAKKAEEARLAAEKAEADRLAEEERQRKEEEKRAREEEMERKERARMEEQREREDKERQERSQPTRGGGGGGGLSSLSSGGGGAR